MGTKKTILLFAPLKKINPPITIQLSRLYSNRCDSLHFDKIEETFHRFYPVLATHFYKSKPYPKITFVDLHAFMVMDLLNVYVYPILVGYGKFTIELRLIPYNQKGAKRWCWFSFYYRKFYSLDRSKQSTIKQIICI